MEDNKNELEISEGGDPIIITFTDIDGVEIPFEFIDLIDYENEKYAAFIPVEETDGAEDVYLFHLTVNEKGEDILRPVTNDNILAAVFEIFKERNSDEFNFVN